MRLIDKVTKLEKQIERLASRRDLVREPIEIQRAILDEVESHAELAGRTRRVFPFNRITVRLLAPDAERRAGLRAVLSPGSLEQAIRDHLRDSRVEIEMGLEVLLRFVRAWPAGSPDASSPFRLVLERTETPSPLRPAAAALVGPARLVVLKGRAARRSFEVSGGRTNIGRLAEVTDKADRVVRRNQVIFLDTPDETTRTVSRAQAHIMFEPPSDYRLHDDRSSYGTRVFRQGRTIEIPSGSPKGLKLRAGDEIYFGQAAVRFEVGEGEGARPSGLPGSPKRSGRRDDREQEDRQEKRSR